MSEPADLGLEVHHIHACTVAAVDRRVIAEGERAPGRQWNASTAESGKPFGFSQAYMQGAKNG